MSRRRSKPTTAPDGLSILDKLILAQAVWEVGTASWLKISRILGKHPLLSHPKTFFTAQSCHAMYDYMMKECNFELSDNNHAVQAPIHLKLAEKYYAERVQELRTLIQAEEQQFKDLVSEIDHIRAGQKDEEIKARITGIPAQENEQEAVVEESDAVSAERDISPDAVDATPADDTTEVEMPPAEPEIVGPEETPASTSTSPPPDPETAVEDAGTEPDAPDGSLDAIPLNETPHIPAEQPADVPRPAEDEFIPDPDVPEAPTVDEMSENPVEESPEENMASIVEEVEPEPTVTSNEFDDTTETHLKPESRNSEASAEGSTPAAEAMSTRRSNRRRTSISQPSVPVPVKKRIRRSQQKSPEPEMEAEEEASPAPTAKEATPALEEPQADEEVPSSAIRRREGKRKASVFGGMESPRGNKRAREDSEPVDDEEQGSLSAVLRRRGTAGRTEEQVALKRFQTIIVMVHSQISQHRNGNIFHNPIKPSEAPDYHDIVKRPIDLKTIRTKVRDGIIGNSLEYQRDICLMFANAMMYNRPGSDVHAMAEDMMIESDSHINSFRQTEGLVRGSRV